MPNPRLTTRKPVSGLTLTQVIEGYFIAAAARRLSENTIADYTNTFRKFQTHFGSLDPIFSTITTDDIKAFLASQTTVTGKTLRNYHTGLSALYTYAVDELLCRHHLVQAIQRPHAERRAIVPYTASDLKLMLAALGSSRTYNNRGTACTHTLPHQDRNRAILFLLIDTGIRAEELCSLTVANLDLRNQRIKVFGKGSKERLIPISPKTAQVIHKYWSAVRPNLQNDEPAFITDNNLPLDRGQLLRLITNIAHRAEVKNPGVHRFRHTFAISFLRNGGDVYTLQYILGHTTLDMCKTYLQLSQTDATSAHRRASPVMNLHL